MDDGTSSMPEKSSGLVQKTAVLLGLVLKFIAPTLLYDSWVPFVRAVMVLLILVFAAVGGLLIVVMHW